MHSLALVLAMTLVMKEKNDATVRMNMHCHISLSCFPSCSVGSPKLCSKIALALCVLKKWFADARHKPWRSSGGDLCGGSRGEIGDKMMILCIDEIGYNKMI